MPLKKDASGRRSIQVEVEVPGTPEEVWRAIATGPGVSSWFVPAKIEEREGGAMTLQFGPGMECSAIVTAWHPPQRFAAESKDLGPNAPPMATEWSVEARSGGVCVVRVVHSLFASTDDWDNQLEGMESGWPTYFRILRLYMTNFRGLPCSIVQLTGFSNEPEGKVWEGLAGSLGLGAIAKGQRWSAPAGVPPMSGVVEAVGEGKHPHTALLRLAEPAPGVAYLGAFSCGGPVQAALGFYFYGDLAPVAVARDEPAWQAWMKARFPMGGGATDAG